MSDGVEVDDTGEELILLVGRLSPISDLFQDICIASLCVIEARCVN